MTTDKAIITLRCLHLLAEEQEAKDAILMAIKALKHPDFIRCKDCAYFVRGKYSDGCKKYSSFSFRPEAFCSNARRRDQ